MAIAAATKTTDFSGFLPREQSEPIFNKAAQASVAQQLIQEVPLGASGKSIPVVTGKMTAGWVAEGAQKPASAGSLGLKTMDPKKIAAIAVVSKEVVRANPGGYMDGLQDQIAEAFALAFDAAVFHGTSTPFSQYLDQTTNAVELGTSAVDAGGVYSDINAGLATLVAAGKRLSGFAFDTRIEPILNAAVDINGRPLFVDNPLIETAANVRAGRMLSRPTFVGDGLYKATGVILGYGGDFSQCAWGRVGGITYDVSKEATVTINGSLVSLWENNLVAILAEAEFGFLCNDVQSFVKYTNAT